MFDTMLRKGPFAALACAVSAAALAAAAPPASAQDMTPEQVADLYMSAIVNHDVAKAQRLDAYLKPAMNGKDAVDVPLIAKAGLELAAVTAQHMKDGAPPQLQHKVDEPIDAFAKTLVETTGRARCTAGAGSIAPNDQSPGGFIATVKYTCVVPDAHDALVKAQAGFAEQDMGKMTPEQFASAFHAISGAYASAPLGREVTGDLQLYAGADKKYWLIGNMDDVLDAIAHAVMSQMPS